MTSELTDLNHDEGRTWRSHIPPVRWLAKYDPAWLPNDVIAGVTSGDRTLRIWPGLYHEIFNEPEQGAVIAEVVRWISERL